MQERSVIAPRFGGRQEPDTRFDNRGTIGRMLVAKRSTRVPFLLLACLMLTGCVDVPLGDDVKLGERSTSSCSKEGRSLLALLHEEIQRGLAEQKNLQLEDAFNCDDSGRDGISVTFDSSDLSTFIAVFEQS